MQKISPYKWLHEQDHESFVLVDTNHGNCVLIEGETEILALRNALDAGLNEIAEAKKQRPLFGDPTGPF